MTKLKLLPKCLKKGEEVENKLAGILLPLVENQDSWVLQTLGVSRSKSPCHRLSSHRQARSTRVSNRLAQLWDTRSEEIFSVELNKEYL